VVLPAPQEDEDDALGARLEQELAQVRQAAAADKAAAVAELSAKLESATAAVSRLQQEAESEWGHVYTHAATCTSSRAVGCIRKSVLALHTFTAVVEGSVCHVLHAKPRCLGMCYQTSEPRLHVPPHPGWEALLAGKDREVANLQAALGDLTYEIEVGGRGGNKGPCRMQLCGQLTAAALEDPHQQQRSDLCAVSVEKPGSVPGSISLCTTWPLPCFTLTVKHTQAAERLRHEIRVVTSKAAALEGELSVARKAAESAAEAKASAERAAAQVGVGTGSQPGRGVS
jgi:hypothetical protein